MLGGIGFPASYEMPGALINSIMDGNDMRDGVEESVWRGRSLFRHDGVEELGFGGVDPVARGVGAGLGFGVGRGFG